MNREHKHEEAAGDAGLNAAMNSWRAPPLSPWFAERAVRHLADHAAALRRDVWPWPPLRLATATVTAAALGCMLSFVVPLADQNVLGEAAQSQTQAQSASSDGTLSDRSLSDHLDDGDDIIALLW